MPQIFSSYRVFENCKIIFLGSWNMKNKDHLSTNFLRRERYFTSWNPQKQTCRGVPRKRCSENMQQIYRRTPMLKCNCLLTLSMTMVPFYSNQSVNLHWELIDCFHYWLLWECVSFGSVYVVDQPIYYSRKFQNPIFVGKYTKAAMEGVL